MKLFSIILAVSLSMFVHATSAASARPAASHLPGVRSFLQSFVAAYSTREINYFFVSPSSGEGADKSVRVYWMTGNAIFDVDVDVPKSLDALDSKLDWAYRKKVDLVEWVVPYNEDIHGSNYLESSESVQKFLLACLGGDKMIVRQKLKKTRLRYRDGRLK